MTRSLAPIVAVVALFLSRAAMLEAADPVATAEMRLREGLRNTMLQLRDAQNQVATLQAEKATSEQKLQELDEQVKKLIKEGADDRDKAKRELEARDEEIAKQRREIDRFKEELAKWQAAQKKTAETASATEAQRATLAVEVIRLQRQVADQQRKNAEMFRIGNEILTRYEKFGLGTALTAREPFVGTTRVKLQNLVQDYGDKLLDQRIKP